MRKHLYVIALMVVVLLGFSGFSRGKEAPVSKTQAKVETLIIAGSGSNIPITGRLLEQYNKKFGEKFELSDSIGSSGAIKAVREGAIELGLISRPIKDEEKGEDLKQIAYAQIGVIIGVNPDVPDNDISYRELVEIYLGKKTSWQNGNMIVVLMREPGDSTNMLLEEKVPGFREVLKDSFKELRWQVYYTDEEETRGIAKTSSSIGFTDTGRFSVFKPNIKPLKVNGLAPTLQNVQSGRYSLFKTLYFVYKEPLSSRAKKFFDFVFSEEGMRIIETSGGIPIRGK